MTNLEMLMNSIEKSNGEYMTAIKSGDVNSENYIIVHNDKGYTIKVENNEIITCDCPHCQNRNAICKHMIKLSLIKKLNIKNLNL